VPTKGISPTVFPCEKVNDGVWCQKRHLSGPCRKRKSKYQRNVEWLIKQKEDRHAK